MIKTNYKYQDLPKPKNYDNLRSMAAEIVSYANSNKYRSISIDLKSFGIRAGSSFQSFCEGLILGSYEFLEYKPKSKGNTLNSISLIGNIFYGR